jgi:hypothetical protein
VKVVTKKIIHEISSVEWFHAVGMVFEDLPEALVVENWGQAVHYARSRKWVHIRNITTEYFWVSIGAISPARADEWNSLFDELAPIVKNLVAEKTARIVKEQSLPDIFVSHVEWDIRNAFIEAEYLDMIAPGFYMNYIINVYHKGHFPCGWIGKEPPEGKPIIF